MQPLGRPVARAALRHARLELLQTCAPRLKLGLGLELRPRLPAGSPSSRSGAIGALLVRYYSTQPPEAKQSAPSTSNKTDTTSRSSKSQSSSPTTELPSTHDSRRSAANHKFSEIMDNIQTRVLTASQTLNEMTGYTSIEYIKRENTELEEALAKAHERVRTARQAFKTSNAKRASTQREVTTLLARKESWSPTDLERFTELYRADHVLEGEVASAQETLTESEMEEQSLSQRLNAGILKRYHEEQIWSDRIRRASTWGTWGLMGMNFVLFVILQFVAEPWKRRRLVRGVVEEEKEVLEEVRTELAAVKASLERTQRVANELQSEEATEPADSVLERPEMQLPNRPIVRTWKEFLLEPAFWKLAAQDLYSERSTDLRMKDASILALEGAAAGAAIAGTVVWALLRTR